MVAGRDRGIVMVLVSTDDLLVPLAALRAAELHVPAAAPLPPEVSNTCRCGRSPRA
jgi:hypothetical protein